MTSEKNKKNVTQNATKQEIGAALKLIGLLYEQGEIPKHVYRNICNEYYGKGLDKVADARYTIGVISTEKCNLYINKKPLQF